MGFSLILPAGGASGRTVTMGNLPVTATGPVTVATITVAAGTWLVGVNVTEEDASTSSIWVNGDRICGESGQGQLQCSATTVTGPLTFTVQVGRVRAGVIYVAGM